MQEVREGAINIIQAGLFRWNLRVSICIRRCEFVGVLCYVHSIDDHDYLVVCTHRWLWYAACVDEGKQKLQQSECAVETYRKVPDRYKRRLHSVCDSASADARSFTLFGSPADFAYIPAKRREEALQIRKDFPYIWNMLLGIQFVYLLSMLEEPGGFQSFNAKYVWTDDERKGAQSDMLKQVDSPDVLHALKLSNKDALRVMQIAYSGGTSIHDEEEDRRHGDQPVEEDTKRMTDRPQQLADYIFTRNGTQRMNGMSASSITTSNVTSASATTPAIVTRKMCTDVQIGKGSVTKVIWVPITCAQTHKQVEKRLR
jgi:hypothetical protein